MREHEQESTFKWDDQRISAKDFYDLLAKYLTKYVRIEKLFIKKTLSDYPMGTLGNPVHEEICIYSRDYEYHIVIRDEKNRNYLGAGYSCRISLPGEDWHRGNDLYDGRLTLGTFFGILEDIISNELVAIENYTLSDHDNPIVEFEDMDE